MAFYSQHAFMLYWTFVLDTIFSKSAPALINFSSAMYVEHNPTLLYRILHYYTVLLEFDLALSGLVFTFVSRKQRFVYIVC